MRVISGNLRGTKLYTLEGQNKRPTLVIVKDSLFNIINFDIKDSINCMESEICKTLQALSRIFV